MTKQVNSYFIGYGVLDNQLCDVLSQAITLVK